jgi:transcriptional regulator with XRE-family HTH domain
MGLEETLKAARLQQGLSVASVAERVGVHANTIRYAEMDKSAKQKTSVGVEIFQRWAGVLGFEVQLAPLGLTKRIASEEPTPLPATPLPSAPALTPAEATA